MAAVETVMIAPVAVFILALSIESGHYMYAEHQVLKGVRDAARYAGRLPLSTWNCTGAKAEADLSSSDPAWAPIANLAIYGNVTATGTPRVWSWNPEPQYNEIQIRVACVVYNNGIYEKVVTPKIAVIGKPNYPSLLLTLGGFNNDMKLYARQQAIGIGI